MKMNRRGLLKILATSIASLPLLRLGNLYAKTPCPPPAPAGVKVVDPTEPAAKRLDYVVDASTSKHAKYKAGQDCTNCKFYTTAKAKDNYAPCKMLGNKFVTGCGWCKSYLAMK